MDATKHLKNKFLTGLFVLIPLIVTLYIIYLVVSSVDVVVSPIVRNLTYQATGLEVYIPGTGFFLFLIIVYSTGLVASHYVGKRFLYYGETVLKRIPFVKGIYSSVKDMTTAFSAEKAEAFQGVVLTEFPLAGRYAMGFITRRIPSSKGTGFCSVFVPTTPNPTSGYLILVKEDELRFLHMPVDKALRYIVSLGTSPVDLPWIEQQ